MFSTSINQAIPFLMLPILTVYLIPKDFGYINTFSAILVIVNSIVGGGLAVNISKNYFVKDCKYLKLLMGNLYFILLCSTILIFGINLFLTAVLNIGFIPQNLFILIPFISFFFVSFEFLKTRFKIKKQALPFTVATLGEVILNISLSLLLIIGLYMQWEGRVYAISFSYFAFGMGAMFYFIYKKYVKFSIDKKILKGIISLVLPLLPAGISIMVMRKSGILFVDSFLGKTQSGLYGVALSISTIILFLSLPFINTWIPHIYKKLAEKDDKDQTISLRNSLFLFSIFILSVCLLVSLASGFILKLMTTDAFFEAKIYIPWLVFGFAFWAIYSMYLPFFIHKGKQKFIAMIACAGAGLNILLNFLVVNNGAQGIAISFFVSNFLTYLLVFLSVRTFIKLPIFPDFKRMGLMIRGLK